MKGDSKDLLNSKTKRKF